MTKYKLETLLKRKDFYEDKYYEACIKENQQIENMGWGYGMRRVKMPALNKSTKYRNKIEEINKLIKEHIDNL